MTQLLIELEIIDRPLGYFFLNNICIWVGSAVLLAVCDTPKETKFHVDRERHEEIEIELYNSNVHTLGPK